MPIDEIGMPLREGADIDQLTTYDGKRAAVKLRDIPRGGEQKTLEIWRAIDPKGEPVRILNGKTYPLSSGQLAFFRFALNATLFVENGTLVLLDEPETHLHPNLVADFIQLLDRILELLTCAPNSA